MSSPPAFPQRSARTHLRRNAVAAAVIVVAVVAWYAFSGGLGRGGSGSSTVVSGTVTVLGQDTGYQDYAFSAPAGSTQVALKGTFTVQGGSPNAVYVLVMNQSSFASWSEGTYYTPSTWDKGTLYYSSGAETTGSFDLSLPAGVQLTLVIYNPQFNNNVVEADASLTYSG